MSVLIYCDDITTTRSRIRALDATLLFDDSLDDSAYVDIRSLPPDKLKQIEKKFKKGKVKWPVIGFTSGDNYLELDEIINRHNKTILTDASIQESDLDSELDSFSSFMNKLPTLWKNQPENEVFPYLENHTTIPCLKQNWYYRWQKRAFLFFPQKFFRVDEVSIRSSYYYTDVENIEDINNQTICIRYKSGESDTLYAEESNIRYIKETILRQMA